MSSNHPTPCRAHPRSRGENSNHNKPTRTSMGSSPLTRGKPRGRGRSEADKGLIPAHAGKTAPKSPTSRPAPAHPRSRGENRDRHAPRYPHGGSSPLTRGKLLDAAQEVPELGLIPAHAGKTHQATCPTLGIRAHPPSRGGKSPLRCRAHPRSRGENRRERFERGHEMGSSPLTRGKHFLTCVFIAQIGQILESLELCAFSESYSSQDAYATDALRGQVRSIDLGLRSSRDAS